MPVAEAKRSSSEARRLLKAEAVRVLAPVQASAPADADGTAGGDGAGFGPRGRATRAAGIERLSSEPAPGQDAAFHASSRAVRLRVREPRTWLSARQRARALVERARAEAEALRSAAREEGFRAGFEAGLEAGREQGAQEVAQRLRAVVERLEEAAAEAARRRDRALARAQEDVVKLALAVAERVVRREVASGPEVTAAVVRSVLQEMPAASAGRVVVRVHPDEHRLLAAGWSPGGAGPAGPVRLEWIADPAVEPGGCVIETEMGTIDAGLEARLVEVASGLLDAMRHGD